VRDTSITGMFYRSKDSRSAADLGLSAAFTAQPGGLTLMSAFCLLCQMATPAASRLWANGDRDDEFKTDRASCARLHRARRRDAFVCAGLSGSADQMDDRLSGRWRIRFPRAYLGTKDEPATGPAFRSREQARRGRTPVDGRDSQSSCGRLHHRE